MQSITFPSGYHIEYGGQFESAADASRLLFWLSVAGIIAILVLLTSVFRSLIDALIIMVNLPLALATALNMLVVPAAYWLFGRRPIAA